MKIFSQIIQFNADTYTPVQLYLALRNQYRKSCLMESNDYHSRQDSKSFIGLEPIVELTLEDGELELNSAIEQKTIPLHGSGSYTEQVQSVLNSFSFEEEKFNGFFGRIGFEFNQCDETHLETLKEQQIPLLHFFLFRYLIVIDHFTNEGYILENSLTGDFTPNCKERILKNDTNVDLPFELFGNERAAFSERAFAELVRKGVEHCKRGDVFQLVLSNRFEHSFFGDDFQVYRQLRRLNPSPYLFYFDFESYRLFGSSPEAQLVVKNGKAEIHPIAGTVPNTGIEETDKQQLEFLLNDEKENAEHTMLVDLARNDLSRECSGVTVDTHKEVQRFSHVTHLVSKVTGTLTSSKNFIALSNSFPAGTLSGTPKPRALELIDQYETQPRGFYGGAIGMFTPQSDMNMAIVIRSVLSQNNTLYYQAGAGIVIDSDPEREVQEVHHKLRAIRTAIRKTENTYAQKTMS